MLIVVSLLPATGQLNPAGKFKFYWKSRLIHGPRYALGGLGDSILHRRNN
jgi:hypothetical protein